MESRKKPGLKAVASSKTQEVVVRRNANKIYGVFIDGVGLDRASRRMKKKVDMAALLKGLTAGIPAKLARYYTILPNDDDSRHRAFLEAITKAGLDVFTKRLPPKGIERQVATDVEMSADMISFALGRDDNSDMSMVTVSGQFSIMPKFDPNQSKAALRSSISPHPAQKLADLADLKLDDANTIKADQSADTSDSLKVDSKRVIVVVCPSRELAYPLALCNHFGADTISADFGKFTGGDLLKSAAKWIDLSDSQTIWK